MKKKYFFLFLILVVLSVALSACGLFGGKKLGKTELTEEMVRGFNPNGNAYVYTGEPIDGLLRDVKVYANGDFVDMKYFDVEISDNVLPGTASVKITAKEDNPTLKGSVTLHFDIVADSSKHCEAGDDLAALLADPGYSAVQMWCNYSVSEDVTITVPEGKTLALLYGYGFENHGTIENYGTVVMEGAHLSTRGRRETEFYNYGTFNNHATLTIKDYVTFNDRGTFTSDNEVTSLGTIYLLDEDKSFLVNGQGGVRYVRHPITAADVTVAEITYLQGKTEYEPQVTVSMTGNVNIAYADNDRAGTAQVTVIPAIDNQYYYGEVVVPFTIKKGKATAVDYDSFVALFLSENYDKYVLSALTVPAGESFTLPADQTLTVTGGLTVNGTLRIPGATCGTLTVAAGGTLENDGELVVGGSSFTVSGTFKNGAHGDWDCGTRAVCVYAGGSLLNQGVVADKRIELANGGTLRNEGTLSATLSSFYGSFVNVGTATLPDGAYQYASGVLTNEQGGNITITGDANLKGSFVNRGVVVNRARIAFDENATYSSVGTFNNAEGGVWAFSYLAGVNENFHLKKHLEDAAFQAEYSETPYNKYNQKPTFTVDGETLSAADYTRSFYSEVQGKYVQECVKTGSFIMRVTIINAYCDYAGSIEHTYSIVPTTIHVSNSSEYSTVYSDAGYNKIVLDADIAMSGYYVGTDCTLDLNGHRITIKGGYSSYSVHYFRIYGTLTGMTAVADPANFTPSEAQASVIVEEYACLTNYGTVVNDGFIYVKGGGTFNANAKRDVSAVEQGVVLNDGVIYTSDDITVQSGSGVVVRRRSIAEFNSIIRIPAVVYDGTEKTPVPEMTYGATSVDMTRFDLVYSNNVSAGSAALDLTVVDPFDRDFYGNTVVNFTIERAVKEIASMVDLIAGATNASYETLRLTKNLTLTANVTLSEDQTLDLDLYDITQSESYKITFVNGSKLIASVNESTRLARYAFAADEITLINDVAGINGAKVKIVSMENNVAIYYQHYLTGKVNYASTVVHLNGHSFIDGLSFSNSILEGFTITFENSSETISTIGTAVGGYAFLFDECGKTTNAILRNITVFGAEYRGDDGCLTAENCKFYADTSAKTGYAFKANTVTGGNATFDNCRFEGATAVVVDGGRKYDHDTGRELPAYFFNGCRFYAYGSHDPTDNKDYYGSALLLDNWRRRGICVQIDGCYMYSEHGNAIQINLHNHNLVNYYRVGNNTFEHPSGDTVVLTPYYVNHT